MANMIEQSLLCKVLDAPDLEILHSNGVIEEMFLTCKDEIHFITEHYNSYKQMPDKEAKCTTTAELQEALGVSRRTLRTDIAYLKKVYPDKLVTHRGRYTGGLEWVE